MPIGDRLSLIEGCSGELWPLPSYAPDLSPVEEACLKRKTGLRRVGARTREALIDAVTDGLVTITASDAGDVAHWGNQVAPRCRHSGA